MVKSTTKILKITVTILVIMMTSLSVIGGWIIYMSEYNNDFVCGDKQPFDAHIDPPKNPVLRLLWDRQAVKSFCQWFRARFGYSYDRVVPPSEKDRQDKETMEIHPQYPANFADDAILMGASHNVFVGEVVEQVGTNSDPIIQTKFIVRVVYNIKGAIEGEVIVNQEGGYKDGVLYVFTNDTLVPPDGYESDYLLKPGDTYLLATRYNPKNNSYTLNPHSNGRKTLGRGAHLEYDEMAKLVAEDNKIMAFERAYRDEILLESDIRTANTLNSYESVHGKASATPTPQ